MRSRFSFWAKVLLAAGLVALADIALFETPGPGLGVALLLVALVAAVALASPARWRNPLGAAALSIAGVFAVVQVDRPSILAVAFVLIGVGVAVLSPRVRTGDDAWRWALRLGASIWGVVGIVADGLKVHRVLKARGRIRVSGLVGSAILPAVGGLIFFGLFVAANPLLSDVFGNVAFLEPDPGRLMFWITIAVAAWTALRPRSVRFKAKAAPKARIERPFASVGSVTAALIVFNLLFALQNGLDAAFLWSGAALPDGMTHAEYAQRGAYPLIATALLAGLFVLVFLRPESPSLVRRLVTLWVAQNVFLVASTMLRTANYIEVYSLTRLRIAALLWMALVALGLILIVWRLLRARSSSWLINANALAGGVVLAGCAIVDLGAVAASWNVRQARQDGPEIDVAYLTRLNGAGLVALAHLESQPMSPELCRKVHDARNLTRQLMREAQSDWRSWRWRDARRLAREAELGGDCTARLVPPPLTPTAKP
jgi:hypothetical protein